MERSLAIVVTYYRLEMLKQCLVALSEQSAACDILVVDNNSPDGTGEWVRAYMQAHPNVHYHNTGENLGGAGGFSAGIRKGIEMGYGYLWLMDDDCLPMQNTLSELLEADRVLDGNYGWLSSVALWTDGTECKMNRQKLKKSFYEYSPLIKNGLVQAEQATFVSLFVRKETVLRFGLPVKEFFIWGDDIEYTRRIAVRGGVPSFVAGKSQVLHAMKDNNGSSIAQDAPERIARYKLAFRNEAYLYRKEGFRGICYYLAKCGLNFLRIFRAPNHLFKRVCVLLGGMLSGLFFRPNIEMIYDENAH